MAHYAFLDENNIVTEVIVGIDETELIEGLDPETWYSNLRGQVCKRTSYRKSDHNPDPSNGIVRAIDVDKDFDSRPSTGAYLADQIRLCAKKDKRISYVIFAGRIASSKSFWRWRSYNGVNRHDHHIHISFTKKGDKDSSFFQIPMLGAN